MANEKNDRVFLLIAQHRRHYRSCDDSEIDGFRMDARGLECRELDVCGRCYSLSDDTVDSSPKTSRTPEVVGYDLGGQGQELGTKR